MDAMAPNRLIVDLGAVAGNIASYQRATDPQGVPRQATGGAAAGPRTRILAMVKALAYGSELVRLSSWLSEAGIDHLGVSTADEGVELRRAGIQLPILVTLPTPEEAAKLARFELLPAVYSFALVEPLAAAARAALPPGRRLAVHLKVDTGMHRVGVAPGEALPLARAVSATGALRVTGLMTHLASAEDPAADGDTRRQLALFDQARGELAAAGFGDLLCHAAATAAAARFPEARYDMVRLGLGLFGLYPSAAVESAISLQLAVTLLSRIAEVRTLARGDRVGYGGTYTVAAERLRVGVLPLGYHDGIPWSLSNRGRRRAGRRPAGAHPRPHLHGLDGGGPLRRPGCRRRQRGAALRRPSRRRAPPRGGGRPGRHHPLRAPRPPGPARPAGLRRLLTGAFARRRPRVRTATPSRAGTSSYRPSSGCRRPGTASAARGGRRSRRSRRRWGGAATSPSAAGAPADSGGG